MRIAVLGGAPGGPGGTGGTGGTGGRLAALLAKRGDPAREVTVFERNRAGDTFGFGVVFSDATLDGPSPRWASWTTGRSATCSPGGVHHDRLRQPRL